MGLLVQILVKVYSGFQMFRLLLKSKKLEHQGQLLKNRKVKNKNKKNEI